jgi:hypothetical protein
LKEIITGSDLLDILVNSDLLKFIDIFIDEFENNELHKSFWFFYNKLTWVEQTQMLAFIEFIKRNNFNYKITIDDVNEKLLSFIKNNF